MLYRTSWVKKDNILYKPSCVVILGVEDEYPLFGKVQDIYIVDSSRVYFCVRLLSTLEFNSHRHVYLVKLTTSTSIVCISSLCNVFPLSLRKISINGTLYLSLVVKYHIANTLNV